MIRIPTLFLDNTEVQKFVEPFNNQSNCALSTHLNAITQKKSSTLKNTGNEQKSIKENSSTSNQRALLQDEGKIFLYLFLNFDSY